MRNSHAAVETGILGQRQQVQRPWDRSSLQQRDGGRCSGRGGVGTGAGGEVRSPKVVFEGF